MKTTIHVDQRTIRRNVKLGTREPCLTVKTYKSNTKCHGVELHGPSRLVYSPDKPLSCGARCYLITDAPVTLYYTPITSGACSPCPKTP